MPESQIQVRLNPDVPPTGSDLAVINAARRSFNTRSDWDYITEESDGVLSVGFQLKEKDKRLIQFLARGMTADDFENFVNSFDDLILKFDFDGSLDLQLHWEPLIEKLWEWRNTPTHESPFGHCFFSFEIKVPLFLARQLVKHKFLRWSEYSRRYITDDVEFYVHDYREAAQNKKQGSGDASKDSSYWQKVVMEHNEAQLNLYNQMIESGIAPEQARGVLPADLMTAVTWSGSLDAFANMCKLRLGSDAQKEAQAVARQVYEYLREYCPVSAKALVEGPDV